MRQEADGSPARSAATKLSYFVLDTVKAATRGTTKLLQKLGGGLRTQESAANEPRKRLSEDDALPESAKQPKLALQEGGLEASAPDLSNTLAGRQDSAGPGTGGSYSLPLQREERSSTAPAQLSQPSAHHDPAGGLSFSPQVGRVRRRLGKHADTLRPVSSTRGGETALTPFTNSPQYLQTESNGRVFPNTPIGTRSDERVYGRYGVTPVNPTPQSAGPARWGGQDSFTRSAQAAAKALPRSVGQIKEDQVVPTSFQELLKELSARIKETTEMNRRNLQIQETQAKMIDYLASKTPSNLAPDEDLRDEYYQVMRTMRTLTPSPVLGEQSPVVVNLTEDPTPAAELTAKSPVEPDRGQTERNLGAELQAVGRTDWEKANGPTIPTGSDQEPVRQAIASTALERANRLLQGEGTMAGVYSEREKSEKQTRRLEMELLQAQFEVSSLTWRDPAESIRELEDLGFRAAAELKARRVGLLVEEVAEEEEEDGDDVEDEDAVEDSSHVLRELSAEDQERVHDAWNCKKSKSEILATHTGENVELTRQDICCLKGAEWLNDAVINLYLRLLKERSLHEPDKYPKVHVFNSFFYKKLSGERGDEYSYKNVRRWTTENKFKLLGLEPYFLTECDMLIVPVHQHMHWTLAVVDIKGQRIEFYDPMGGGDSYDVIPNMKRYIADEAQNKQNMDLDCSNWVGECRSDIPKQTNGYDCGVFMLMFAEHAARNATPTFRQQDMGHFRELIASCILKQKMY